MPERDDDQPGSPADPIMPTGNGPTDLEIAREQAAVNDAEAGSEKLAKADAARGEQAVRAVPADDASGLSE